MASCNSNSDPYRPPRDKYKECCDENKQQVEKGNKYGADELKVYIKKQKEIRKYRELQEFEERERLLESKKQRLRELDVKCKQIASKNQFPPFPVPQSQQVQCQSQHNQQANPAASQLYQQQQKPPPPRERDVRDRDIFPQKFASQTVTSTNTKNNLPPISDRDRNSLGHALSGKPKLKRTKYTNQDFSSSQASGNKGQERERDPALVTTEAKRSKSNCKLERQAANFIFKEFENIVRRECKNLLRTRSSQFQSLSGESSTSIGSNSNSKSEVNLHFRDRTRDRDRNRNRDGDRDRDRDSSNSQSSSRDNKERKSRSSKSHPDKFIIGNTTTQPTQSTSATNTHFNNLTTQTNHSRIDRDRHQVEQRERTVITKVDKNVGTSFTLYDSIDRREREMNSSDCCSSVDMDDSRSHLSDVNRLASSKGFHSLFQSNNKTKTQHNQQRKSLPPYVIPRPDDYQQLKRERVQQRIPEGVKHAAAAKIQAAYKSYKIRSILSEAKLRPRTSQSSNYLASELIYRHTNGNGNPPPNHSVNHKHHHKTHHPMSPTIEFSSGDSRNDVKKSQIHFYKSNQNQKLQPPAASSPPPLHQQPTPEKPYDERSQRRMSALFNVPGGPSISIPRPSQHSPAEGPVKPNPEDIPGYIPPPAGYGYSPIPRAPSYSPRTLPLLRLRHLDEPFPKQALDNLEFGSSQHSLNGQPSACQSPVKLISSISKFQMPHSLQVQQSANHGHAHGYGPQQQVPLSSPPGPIPVTYIPKPSSHPPSFLVEAKNKRVIPQSRLAALSSGQQKQQQNLYTEISSRIPGPGIQFKNQSFKVPEQSSAAFGSGTGAGPPPLDFKIMQSQFKKSMTTSALVDLPDPGFTTVLQEKIRLLRSNNIDNAGISRIMQIHTQNQSNQNRINILGPGPGTSSAGAATSSTAAGVGAAAMNSTTNAIKSPIRRSQMTAVSKATEQIKKKIVEAKQILEDYKMELLRTNSCSNMSQLHQGQSRVRDSDIEADLTYESDFDVDSQSRSVSQLLQQDQQSLCGHDSDILQSHSQSLEADVQLSQIIAAKTKERDQRRLERERQKEAVALRYTIPRPSSITGSRSTSRSSRENVNVHDREMRTKTKASQPPSAEHSAYSDFQEIPASQRSKSHSSAIASQSQSERSDEASASCAVGSGSRSRSKSKSKDSSVISRSANNEDTDKTAATNTNVRSTGSQSQYVQVSVSGRDIPEHVNVSSRSSRGKDNVRSSLQTQSKSHSVHQQNSEEPQRSAVSISDRIRKKSGSKSSSSGSVSARVPSPVVAPTQHRTDHESDTDYDEIAPSVSRASSNLPTEDIVYDMDFDTDVQTSRSKSIQSRSETLASKSRRSDQPSQAPSVQVQQQKASASTSHKGSLPPSVVIDLDITSRKSDEGPSEESSLSFSLSLNAQGQQLQQKQEERQESQSHSQSVSVGPSKGYDNFEIDEQDGEVGVDVEENLPSMLSPIMAEEDLVSASIQLDQSLQVGPSDQEEEAELVDESIAEDFELPSHSVGHVKSSQKELKSQGKAPEPELEQWNQELQEEPEPNSKDTTAFDDKIDTNLSFSMPSGVYEFDDEFNTDVSNSNVQSEAGDGVEANVKKPTEKTSGAVDLEQVEIESEAKDDTIIEEVEEEETEDGNVDAEESSIGIDAGARASTKAGHNQNEFEVADDSFLSEIPEDIVSSTKSNSISFVQGQNQLELDTLRNQKISISSISEDSPPTSTTKTKGDKKGSQGEVKTGVKQEYNIDISGKIVGEMDSILSDASNIPEDHHVPIGSGSSHVAVGETETPEKFEDLEFDLDTEISEKSKSHSKKSQNVSTQKSATTDFSQQANFIVTQQEAVKNYIFDVEKQTEDTIQKSKSPSPVLKDLDDGVKAGSEATNFNDAPVKLSGLSPISTPLPPAVQVLADQQSDEEISEIAEDLPSEGISQSSALSKSEKEKSRHEDASSDKSMKSKSKSKTPELPEETPLIVPVSGNATATTTAATTWDAELSAKSPISVSHSEQHKGTTSDLPVQIEVQAPSRQVNVQLQSQSPPPPQSPLEFQSQSQTSEISEDVPQTPDDASSSESEESQSRSRKGTIGERPVAETTSKETAGVVLSATGTDREDIAAETEIVEVEAKIPELEPEQHNLETLDVSIQSVADPNSFLASIASQVSEILSKSSKSAAASQKSEGQPLSRKKSEEDEAALEASLSKKSETPDAVKSVSSKSESPKLLPPAQKQEEKDNSNLLDLAKTMDTDIIEKIESLIADEISKQMELEEKENDNEESQSTNSQATEIDADDSKFSAASYSNFHVEDVVYESDFDTDVQSQSEKSCKSEKSVAVSKSNSVSKSTNTKNGAKSTGAGTKHSGLLEAVVKNEVELLVREQSERLKNATQEKTGEGDFIRNENGTGTGTIDVVPSQIENEIPLNKIEKTTNIEIASTAASVTKPKLGVEARVRTILDSKETMDGLVTRIIARMLKEVSLARSVAFKGLTSTSLPLANTKLSVEDVHSGVGVGSTKDGSTSTRMMQVLEEDDNDDNSVSTHEEVDVDGDAEWFEDDIISGGNTAEDESLKREAAEIVAEQMRIENEIRALEALQAQVPATLMNLSDVPDKPPPPYSPPSSDSASLGLQSFAIQYTQKQLQDLIHNQVDRIWDEWSSTKKFPIYEYIDDSEDFPLKSLPLFLDESTKENEPSGGDTTQTMTTNNKKEKESKSKENESLPIPVLSTRAFNTLLFDLIKDTMKDILLIEDEKCNSNSSIGKDYVDRIRPGSLSIEAQKMRIPKTKDGLFKMIYMRVKNLLPYPLLTNDVPVPRRRLTKWTSRPRDLVDEVLAEELIDEDREWTESWPEEILVIDRWSEKFSRRAVREVMGAFKAVFTTTTSV